VAPQAYGSFAATGSMITAQAFSVSVSGAMVND
jgi:hypothetical protein